MQILVDRKAPFCLPPVYRRIKKTINGIDRNMRGERLFKAVTLLPGPNQVSAEYWNAVKDQCAGYEQCGILVVGEGEVPESKDPGKQLKTLSAADALVVIAETSDPNLLTRWMNSDKRSGVQQAIIARAKEVQGATQ